MSPHRPFHIDQVLRAQEGDEQAFEALLAAVEPMLRAFFYSRIGRRTEVDDLVQNTLMRLHRGLPELNDPRRLKSFTMKAAVFELQDYYRGRYSGREHLFDPGEPPEAGVSAPPSGDRVDVDRLMRVLSDKARRILELREAGYRYEEIAQLVDTTEAAVKMQVKRAFDRMRDIFSGDP